MYKNYLFLYFFVTRVFFVYCVKHNKCQAEFTDENSNPVELDSFCKKPCITKCCKPGYLLGYNKTCILENGIAKETKEKLQNFSLSDAKIYFLDKSANEMRESEKEIGLNFSFVYNNNYNNASCYYSNKKNHHIMEDGSLTSDSPHAYNRWGRVDKHQFCVDIWLNEKTLQPQFKYLKLKKEDSDIFLKTLICGISMAISSLFLLMVLLVYAVLPQLQTIGGLMLMAHVASLATAYILRALADVVVISNREYRIKEIMCLYMTPPYYFAILASFLWLNVMSFDIWWTLRSSNSTVKISPRKELIKFFWYSVYAFGIAAMMTVAAVIVDIPGVVTSASFVTPRFNSCFGTKNEIYYLLVPLGIITGTNCVLYCITSYNIWIVNRRVQESMSIKRNKLRVKLFVKLSLVMGVSWVLEFTEFVTGELPVWLYVLVNAYNMFIGLAVFLLFVAKKSILVLLCQRFNIQNRFVEKYCSRCT